MFSFWGKNSFCGCSFCQYKMCECIRIVHMKPVHNMILNVISFGPVWKVSAPGTLTFNSVTLFLFGPKQFSVVRLAWQLLVYHTYSYMINYDCPYFLAMMRTGFIWIMLSLNSSVFWDITVWSPEEVDIHRNTRRCYTPEDRSVHNNRCENIESCNLYVDL